MEEFLQKIPDKIVSDDILNFYISKQTNKHLFSDIGNFMYPMKPNFKSHLDMIDLYRGEIMDFYEGKRILNINMKISYT